MKKLASLSQKTYAIVLSLVLFVPSHISSAQETTRLLAVHKNDRGAIWRADLVVSGNTLSGYLSVNWEGITVAKVPCKKTKIKSNGKFKIWCKTQDTVNRSLKGTVEKAKLTAHGKAGGALFQFVSGDDVDTFLERAEGDEKFTTDEYLNNKSS